jgi:hypothetical protein
MAGQLLPPPDQAPAIPKDATPEQSIALWVDLMNACEEFLLAGLRREVGPDGDLKAAYRAWYAQWQEEHDRAMFRMLEELDRRERCHGG